MTRTGEHTQENTDWRVYARRLADELRERGKLDDQHWYEAVCEVPRHRLVPVHHQSGKLVDTTGDRAYRNQAFGHRNRC